jgi:hypothetical protein
MIALETCDISYLINIFLGMNAIWCVFHVRITFVVFYYYHFVFNCLFCVPDGEITADLFYESPHLWLIRGPTV